VHFLGYIASSRLQLSSCDFRRLSRCDCFDKTPVQHRFAAGTRKLIRAYRTTGRNQVVAHHDGKLLFNGVRKEESGLTEWVITVDSGTEWKALPINIVSIDFTFAAERRNDDPA
jgi:hypothetical protein